MGGREGESGRGLRLTPSRLAYFSVQENLALPFLPADSISARAYFTWIENGYPPVPSV
jgi:hypothetical protein